MGKNSKKQFRRNERTYRGHHNLDKFLAEKSLQRKPIAKDGSCLFRAVAEQVFSSQSCHQRVRMQCVEYIQAHQDDFKEFITVSIPEYLDHLKCELWGGEVELVVLSRLYDRQIIVYNEASGLVHEQVFQSSEDQSSSQQHNPITLAYSGGNHYDSVYSIEHMKNTAFCQGLVYETFFCRVMRDPMPIHCQQRLTTLQESDIEQLRKYSDVDPYSKTPFDRPTHLLSTHYSPEEVESMAANTYRNIALDVHQREKASIERRDRRVAASIQFQRGDSVICKIGNDEMEGEICSLNVSQGCHLVFMLKSKEEWQIPAKDIVLKPQSYTVISGGRRTSSQSQARTRPQPYSTSQTISQKGQPPLPPPAASSDSTKAAKDTPGVPKETPSSKKAPTQSVGSTSSVVKPREGKRGSGSQQGAVRPATPTTTTTTTGQQQNPPKTIPSNVASSAPANRKTTQAPPPSTSSSVVTPPPTSSSPGARTPTPDVKQPSSTTPPGTTKGTTEQGHPGPRRGAAPLSRNINVHTQQTRSQPHGFKTTGHLAKVTKRTDAGSLDSEGPSSSSGDEDASSPRGTSDKLPTYYDDNCWVTGAREAETKIPQQQPHKQQPLQQHKEKKNLSGGVVGGKSGRNLGGYTDTTSGKQPMRAQKSASAHTVKGSKVGEVKVQPSKSVDASTKAGTRQASVTPATKAGDTVRTSPVGKQQQQQHQTTAITDPSPPAGLLQQQSPIQGLIDGPNSGPNGEKGGRDSPPYLDRQIPRDPSSQPQDAWPMFEEDPGISTATCASSAPPVTTIMPMMLNAAMAQKHSQQQQQQRQQHTQAPPPSAPPLSAAGPGILLPSPGGIPSPTTTTTTTATTHNVNAVPHPPPPAVTAVPTNRIPVCLLPSVVSNTILTTTPPARSVPPAHQPPQQKPVLVPTPPQSPHSSAPPNKDQGTSATATLLTSAKPQATAQPQPKPQQQQQQPPPPQPPVMAFRQPVSPPATSIPSMLHYQSLLQQAQQSHPFMTPMSTAAAAAMQFYRGSLPHHHHHPGSMELLYNQAQSHHHHQQQQQQQHHHSNVAPELPSNKPVPGATKLIAPLQPLSTTKKSSTLVERTSMSPLLVTAYTQTVGPKVSTVHVQTEEKKKTNRYSQTPQTSKKVKKTQTEGEFMPVEDLQPPLLESDTKLAQVNFAIQYSIQCLNVYLQYCNDDETAAETLSMLEALEEQRKSDQSLPYESQLTALNASQQDFLVSLAREKSSPFTIPAPLAEGLPGLISQQQTKQVKEAVPSHTPVESEEQTKQQTSTTSLSTDSSSELHSPNLDDEKSGSVYVDVTPQQEAQPPAVTPFPVPPVMMPQQRPSPYMMPMPMFYGPTHGFYPPSFPGMPGMPSMMMPPYGHHMIPQAHAMMQQQQQQQNQQQDDSVEDNQLSAPTSTRLPPTPMQSQHTLTGDPATAPLSSSGELESSVDAQNVLTSESVDHVNSLTAIQPSKQSPDYHLQNPAHTSEETVVLPSAQMASSMLEELHQESNGELPDIQYQLLVDKDVNMSNPGLPCRGTSTNMKDLTFFDNQDGTQKTEPKQHKQKGSRSRQENASKSSKSSGSSQSRQQANAQKSGTGTGTGTGNGSSTLNNPTKSAGYNQGESSFNKKHNPPNRQQQQYTTSSGRRYQNSRKSYTGGRFNQTSGGGRFPKYGSNPQGQSGQQGSASNPSSSKKNPGGVGTSGGVGSGQDKPTVTPIPATNNSTTNESGDRNISQWNNLSSGGGGGETKSFTSFPASPHSHTSSIHRETALNPGMIAPQTVTDFTGEDTKKKFRWQFKENPTDRQKLEVPDPKLLHWSSDDRQRDYAETVEDPFLSMGPVGDDKEFALRDIGDMDTEHLQELFPALKQQIPGRYDSANVHGCPVECTTKNDAPSWMLAGVPPMHSNN